VSVNSFSTWILRWHCVPALLCYLYSHLYTCVMCSYCIDSHCYWCMARQMFRMLHEIADLFHICMIQWNIIKRWDEKLCIFLGNLYIIYFLWHCTISSELPLYTKCFLMYEGICICTLDVKCPLYPSDSIQN
jgi:hypothetical protein